MSGTSAVDAFTPAAPLIEPRYTQGIVRQHLADDRGEPRQRDVEIARDGKLAQQLQQTVEICALKVQTVGSAVVNSQHRDSPPCLRRFWALTPPATTSVRAHSCATMRHISLLRESFRVSCGQFFRVVGDNLTESGLA